MRGQDICRFIKNSERYKIAPVIIMLATPGLGKMAKDAGADGIIAKPFSLKLLRETISEYLS
jgi:CheY-like chemotaxis protein